MNKKLFLSAIIFSLLFSLFAQENSAIQEKTNPEVLDNINEHQFSRPVNFIQFIHSLDFVIETEPGMYFNPESKLISAPSPVIYPVSIGVLWPNYTMFGIQPTLSFFMMEHLWYDGKALPAEIENRTSTTLSFMLTIPAVITFYFNNSRLQLMPGISLLSRIAFLANNVNPDDSGYSLDAQHDLDLINEWFWSDLHFLYISAGFSWLINLSGNLKAGPVVNFHIPLSIFNGSDGMQGFIISAGLKLSL